MEHIFSVSEVNNYIKDMFRRDRFLADIAVKGEASNVKYHSSGHIYFTLKDESGQMSCVMFSSQRFGLSFRLEEGLGIIVFGQISVYERDGRYQIYAREIRLDGRGKLYEQFEALKNKLEQEGLFSDDIKRPIPRYPKKIGIVTANTGAAIRDIINISTRRNPYVQLILSPALVQGEAAPSSLVKALKKLYSYEPDTIIIGRGGGSIEDLWAFNDEAVAREISACPFPIISAVGHETDFTIADFVSDLRAPTPSAAAELAVNDVSLLESGLVDLRYDLYKAMSRVIENNRSEVERFEYRLKALSPKNKLDNTKQYCCELENGLKAAFGSVLTDKKHKFEVLSEKLDALSPLKKLTGGFGYVSHDNRPVLSASDIHEKDSLQIRLSDGEITAVAGRIEIK